MAQKKTFKDNPALQFISSPATNTAEVKTAPEFDTGVPMKRNPLYIETRSKRLNLLMQPSLHAKLKEIAAQQEISINELIHNVLEKYTEREI